MSSTDNWHTEKSPVTGREYRATHEPRYMGISTFMRAPLAHSLEGVDIGLVGVPYDGGVTNRPGARHGPHGIRDASNLMRPIHHVTRVNPFDQCHIADLGDVRFTSVFSPEAVSEEIRAFYARLADAGVAPLSAGGDHSVTYPILKGIHRGEPFSLIHVDAHTDTWDKYMGSKFHHGGPFRLATEDGLIDPKHTIQIGIRGAQTTTSGWDYSIEKGMRVVFMEEFTDLGVAEVIKEARRVVGDRPVYLTFDIDGLDPVYAPGTGTPEVGGITTIEAQRLIRGLSGLPFVGGDVVEVSPPFDPSGNTSLVGATIMYEILCVLAQARSQRAR